MIRRLISLLFVAASAIFNYNAEALDANFYASSSPLSQGRWVRIGVDTTGVYEISYDDLSACGFSDPSSVRVYGYGGVLANDHHLDGSVPDALPLVPSVHTADKRLVFYGEGTVRADFQPENLERIDVTRNPYDTRGHYFLTDSRTDGEVAVVPYTGGASGSAWHYCIDLSEREVQQPGDGSGVIFHGPRLTPGAKETASFRVRNFGWDENDSPRGIFELEAAVNTSNKVSFELEMQGAGNIVTDIRPSGTVNFPQRLWIAAGGGVKFGADESHPLADSRVDVTVGLPSSFSGSYAAIDRCYLIYPRLNRIEKDMTELMLNYANVDEAVELSLSGADKDVEIWDVTDPAAVRCLAVNYDTQKATAKATMPAGSGTRRLVAFNPSQKHRKPHIEGPVENQNLHAQKSPEILVITTETMLEHALELVEIHREQGQSALVVTQEALFNEFGSGTRSSAAMRRAIKMYYDRSDGRMRHVILYGSSTGDPRFICRQPADLLLTYICESFEECRTLFKNYVSDQYFGMMSDSFDPEKIEKESMQLSTGRIPVSDADQARTVNTKIRNYFIDGPTPAMALRVFKSSDKLNDAIHLKYANQMAAEMSANNDMLTITHGDFALYDDADAVTAEQPIALLERSLLRGSGMFYYTGHGGETSLSGTDFYNMGRVKDLHYSQQPLIVFASCLTYPFDRKDNTLLPTTVLTPDGGSFGAIGACREVLLEYNRPFSNAVGKAYAQARGGTDAGEILKNARNLMIEEGIMSGDLAFNELCFNYCGDPALPLALPHFNIEIDDVGGDKFVSGKSFEISGRVVDSKGSVVQDFDGPVHIEIFDGAIDRKSLVTAVKDIVMCDDNLLCEFTAQASKGIISSTVYLPTPSQGNRPSRMVVTATDTDSRRYAAGVLRKNGIEEATEDQPGQNDAPVILSFGVADDDYIEPGVVKPNFTLSATVDPSSSGLAVGVSGIRNRITIIVDGKDSNATAVDGMRFNQDGTVSLTHQIIDATFGTHTYTLRVVNNAGLSASSDIEVSVGSYSHKGTLSTDIEGTVRESVEFTLVAGAPAKRLIVVDHKGNTVVSVEEPEFPYSWDLNDLSGRKVSDGRYKAWAMLADDLSHGSTPICEFTVIGGRPGSSVSTKDVSEPTGKTLDLSEASSIAPGAYAGSDVEQIILPASGKLVIGDGAFAGSRIRKLVINCDAVIGLGAFAACEQLESVEITGSTTVGEYAFRNCESLKSAVMRKVATLPAKAFAGCSSLSDVKIGNLLTSIGVSAFEGCGLESIDLSATSVKTIGAYAFNGNHKLTSIKLPLDLAVVGEGAFFDCMSLEEINLPQSCRRLDSYSLKGLSGLDSISLPGSLTYIGRSAMEGMSGLKSINATDLLSVPELGEEVWYGLPQSSIRLRTTKDTKPMFDNADQWRDFDVYYDSSTALDQISGESGLRGRMTDGVISIESASEDIAEVDVYSASGMLIYRAAPGSQTCEVDVKASDTHLFIVRVRLADGTCASLKFVR